MMKYFMLLSALFICYPMDSRSAYSGTHSSNREDAVIRAARASARPKPQRQPTPGSARRLSPQEPLGGEQWVLLNSPRKPANNNESSESSEEFVMISQHPEGPEQKKLQ